ncbi:DUF5590 domain-containing protein [Pontibacillus salicampi]|uniref:DUF5590 domain-containing protein n=2 Tax=Pontibacillus salicampi TaxID=1449801 RepID=A0ABV6LLA2_9BACI
MMKTQRYSPSTERSKITYALWGLGIIAFIAVLFFSGMYIQIMGEKTDTYNQSEQQALNQTELSSVHHVSRYHGPIRYDIVAGVTKEGKKGYAFIPKDTEQANISYVALSDVLTEDSMKQQWQSTCNACELIDIIPAHDGSIPLWEVTFTDSNERYAIQTFNMKSGSKVDTFYFRR